MKGIKRKMILNVNSKTLVLLQGLPGSGKSTFIKENELEEYTLCKDEFRIKAGCITDEGISQDCNGIVKRIVYMLLEARLKNGKFTIIDETCAHTTTVDKYKEYAKKYGFDVVIIRFDISREESYGRQVNRGFRAVSNECVDRLDYLLAQNEHEYITIDNIEGIVGKENHK
jgi:2',3'-cyclic-nucleotide 3'-phosphodiesterase